MKTLPRFVCLFLSLFGLLLSVAAQAATTYTLNPLTTFTGFNGVGDGSIKPGQSLGTNPITGNEVDISAPQADLTGNLTNSANTNGFGFGWQPGDLNASPQSTLGFNMRGLAYDPVTTHLIFVDTHTGQNGSQTNVPNAAIYILDSNTGKIIDTLTPSVTNLNTAGVINDGGGIGVFCAVGVGDDGVVYACSQVNQNTAMTTHFKIWRWPTADTNSPGFTRIPTLAVSQILNPPVRMGQTMAVRGSGNNTLLATGESNANANNGYGTNVWLFTTTDGTNFSANRVYFPGLTNAIFNDGIAFGPGNTLITKQVAAALSFVAWPNTLNGTNGALGTIIASYTTSSTVDPLLNLSGIAYDPSTKLLAGLEEIAGSATGGNGKVWLFDFASPTNHPPAILATRVYTVNFQKTTAPMGYICFGNGHLYAHASNNGFLCSRVDSVTLGLPSYLWTDFNLNGQSYTRNSDLPATTRASDGGPVHFEVFAVADVTNYQWFSNNVLIAGVNGNNLDLPVVNTNMSGIVFKAVAQNAAGSSNSTASTLLVVSPANLFHLNLLWSITANTIGTASTTNFITSGGGTGTPNERTIAYNAISNQLLVVRGPAGQNNLKIFVITDPEALITTNGGGIFTNASYPLGFPTNVYLMNTNGITPGGVANSTHALTLGGIGVADDGAVYAASVASDDSFKVFRWANTGPSTQPVVIFGTNSSAASAAPMADLLGTSTFRFGDALAVRGSGTNTEIIMDATTPGAGATKYVAILTPTDATMVNWTSTGNSLRNAIGSYGSQSYGTGIGRSIQFGQGNTFWQKRFFAPGSPLAEMNYTPLDNSLVCDLVLANLGNPIFTNGSVAINFQLKVACGINFAGGGVGNSVGQPDTLSYFDVTDPSQAVQIGSANLPGANAGGGRMANANAVAQVIFGQNPTSHTNYVFAIDGNNGIAAYTLAGGVFPPPHIITQPNNLRLLIGGSGTMGASLDQTVAGTWYKGTNPPVNTGVQGTSYTINSASANDVGDYFLVASNLNGVVTSALAHVSVTVASDEFSLAQVFGVGHDNPSFPYISNNGMANSPYERSIAYNALSNQLIVVHCVFNSTTYALNVVDGTSGALLYTLNTAGVVHETTPEVAGSQPYDLLAVAAADDGSIYLCNETPNASGGAGGDTTKMWNLYRWTNSAPATPPVLVFQGDPSFQPAGVDVRWGDMMTVRGAGINTEVFVNSQDGAYGAVLKPIDASLNIFTSLPFGDSGGSGSIGRSIQFGTNNTVFEKRKGSSLVYSRYDTNAQVSTIIYASPSSATLGGVAVDTQHNLAVGVDFVGSGSQPDAVALYDIVDPTAPLLVHRYNFPSNQVANANSICETIISGSRVYALDANNGILALNIVSPQLSITPTPDNTKVVLSWAQSGLTLQSSPSISPTSWTDVGTGTLISGRNYVTNNNSGALYYRLR